MEKGQLYGFGRFLLDPSGRKLLRSDEPVPLTPRVFDTLVALVSAHGRVVSKEELLGTVWRDVFVEDNNLSQSISALRKALGDDGNGNRYVATVPRKGYSFVAQVAELPRSPVDGGAADASESSPSLSRASERRVPWRRFGLAAAVLLCAVAGALWSVRARREAGAIPRIGSIAVLPLKELPRPRREEYLGLALADSLITRLGRIGRLSVRPTGAVRPYGADAQDAVSAGRALSVEAVLDGEIQRSGDRMRVTVQLVEVATGVTLWTHKIDVSSADLFAVEDAISEKLAQKLASGETVAAAVRKGGHTASREAYEAYLKGRFEWNKRTADSFRRGAAYFEQAISSDPRYAAAFAGLADCRNLLGNAPGAKQAAQRAVEIDPSLAEAHAALGNVALFYDFDRSRAEKELREAISLNRSYATAHQWLAYALVSQGRFVEALAEIESARAIDPFSLSIATDVADILLYARRYDEAASACRKALNMDPNFLQAHVQLGQILKAKGDFAGAIREFSNGGEGGPLLAATYAFSGRRDEARRLLERYSSARPRSAGWHWDRAVMFIALGEKESALSSLREAYEGRFGQLVLLAVDPEADPLRSDPRFTELLRAMHLDEAPVRVALRGPGPPA
jgi:DNA-binding winged helix-turn-helix (wHTH) protein/TolB-like protein